MHRVSKTLKTERQTERKHNSVGECMPFECASVDSWQHPCLSYYAAGRYRRLCSGPSPASLNGKFIRVCWPSVGKVKAVVSAIQCSNSEFRLEVYDD